VTSKNELGSSAAFSCQPVLESRSKCILTGASTDADGSKANAMSCLKFEVHQTGRGRDWVVLVGGKLYGRYLSREEAVLDAFDAAEDARRSGRAAEVFEAGALAPGPS
jgi:hypothetical protein